MKTKWKTATYRETEYPWECWSVSKVQDRPLPELDVIFLHGQFIVIKKESA